MMPLFDFRCESCGMVSEEFRSSSNISTGSCRECGADTKRVWSTFATKVYHTEWREVAPLDENGNPRSREECARLGIGDTFVPDEAYRADAHRREEKKRLDAQRRERAKREAWKQANQPIRVP